MLLRSARSQNERATTLTQQPTIQNLQSTLQAPESLSIPDPPQSASRKNALDRPAQAPSQPRANQSSLQPGITDNPQQSHQPSHLPRLPPDPAEQWRL